MRHPQWWAKRINRRFQQKQKRIHQLRISSLKTFWEEVKGKTSSERLEIFKKMAGLQIARISWQQWRYDRNSPIYYERGTYCFICNGPAAHRHHIILIRNGGDNHPHNILSVCLNCHSKIHGFDCGPNYKPPPRTNTPYGEQRQSFLPKINESKFDRIKRKREFFAVEWEKERKEKYPFFKQTRLKLN